MTAWRRGLSFQTEPRKPSGEARMRVAEAAGEVRCAAPEHQDWLQNYVRHQSERIAHDVDLALSQLAEGCRVLDCGASPFLLSCSLASLGFQVDAVDLAPERFPRGDHGPAVQRCDVERDALPFPDGCFDAVIFNELFEHLRINPLLTLREVLRVLRPGGALFLSTPNLRSFDGLRNFLIHGRAESCETDPFEQYSKLEELGHMGHVREFTPCEVVGLLRRLGFQPSLLVWRGRAPRALSRRVARLLPSLRPFFSVLARKPVADAAATR